MPTPQPLPAGKLAFLRHAPASDPALSTATRRKKTRKSIVANLPHRLPRTQKAAIAYLQKEHPEFFANPVSQGIAAIIIAEFPDELAKLSPVQRTGMLAGIMALMFDMGAAALKALHDPRKRGMAKIFIATKRRQEAKGTEDE
jgi:hypothetical protein